MEEKKNNIEPEETGNTASEQTARAESEKVEQKETKNIDSAEHAKGGEKKPFDKKNWKMYAAILVGLAVIITVIVLIVGGGKPDAPAQTTPGETTPAVTTPKTTTPAATTPPGPTEPVTFPSDEDNDPKQEDNFFE